MRWNRQWGWAPEITVFLVTQIDDLARRVGDRVVAPRRQPIRLAVLRPGITRAALGNQEAEDWVGDHVDPWGGGEPGIGGSGGHRLPVTATMVPVGPLQSSRQYSRPSGVKPAQSIGEKQIGRQREWLVVPLGILVCRRSVGQGGDAATRCDRADWPASPGRRLGLPVRQPEAEILASSVKSRRFSPRKSRPVDRFDRNRRVPGQHSAAVGRALPHGQRALRSRNTRSSSSPLPRRYVCAASSSRAR